MDWFWNWFLVFCELVDIVWYDYECAQFDIEGECGSIVFNYEQFGCQFNNGYT